MIRTITNNNNQNTSSVYDRLISSHNPLVKWFIGGFYLAHTSRRFPKMVVKSKGMPCQNALKSLVCQDHPRSTSFSLYRIAFYMFFSLVPQGNESVLLSTVEHVVEKAVSAATSNLGQLIEEKMATQAGGGGVVVINVGPVTSYQYRAMTPLIRLIWVINISYSPSYSICYANFWIWTPIL